MQGITIEVVVIAVLLLANGLFAMAEIAVVASRKTRLKAMADAGSRGAKLAVGLAEAPGRFLSTVQVGITLFGVLSGVIGGARIAGALAEPLARIPWLGPASAELLVLAAVTIIITYFSVVIGELVPKRLALNHPERIASVMAAPMQSFSVAAGPLVHLLSVSTDALLGALGVGKSAEPPVSEEEVRVLIDEGLSTGVFNKAEKLMVEGVFNLDEQTADDLMTPRARLVWLCLDDPDEENWRRIAGSGHSHFPVYRKTKDNVVGMVSVKALWANLSLAGTAELRALITPPLYVPATMPASTLIAEFKKSGKHIALVIDEFGGLQGLVTLKDVMMAIVGDLPERGQHHEPKALRNDDGSWLMDALLEIAQVREHLGILESLPGEEEDEFSTLGGFLLARLGHIPVKGEKVVDGAFVFEVIEMDRLRIDKVLVHRLPGRDPAMDVVEDGAGV
jgi:putative hemolysin